MTHLDRILHAAKGVFGLLLAVQSFGQTALDTGVSASSSHLAKVGAGAEHKTIRTFRVNVPREALDDLRRGLAATRWPDQETVADRGYA